MTSATAEIARGERFEFGENWKRFLTILTPERIESAEQGLRAMLAVNDLRGKDFLDIGSGSGLFSLSARRLGARVVSFDYDPDSVACTQELRRRFFPGDPNWEISLASVLNESDLQAWNKFDVVYSWGVLHHTGAMWQAVANACRMVKPGGILFISLYNDQGNKSERWAAAKRFYVNSPRIVRSIMCATWFGIAYWKTVVKGALSGDPFELFREYGRGAKGRGMSAWRDTVDWLGGYPFEVAKPGEVLDFAAKRDFTLTRLITTNDSGCNQFVFKKLPNSLRP